MTNVSVNTKIYKMKNTFQSVSKFVNETCQIHNESSNKNLSAMELLSKSIKYSEPLPPATGIGRYNVTAVG